MKLEFNKLGKIIEGDNCGWFVKIIDDTTNSGGFIVYKFKDEEGKDGFDTWLENENDVRGYIYESEWKIDWEGR